ncbi:MAG: hypothetical protein LKJ03_11200 [Enterococcaceae bacterium]|nr:hypothetical protein [Enterococcaceae bacterium]
MLDQIYRIQILNPKLSVSDICAIASIVISLITVLFIVIDRSRKNKTEKMNLAVGIKKAIEHTGRERLFIFFTFANASSLPITINSIKLTVGNEVIPDTSEGEKGGSTLLFPEEVSGYLFPSNNKSSTFIENAGKTLPFPLVIEPYTTRGGFVGIYAGDNSASIIPDKQTNVFIVETSRLPIEFNHYFLLDGAEYTTYRAGNIVKKYQNINNNKS